MNCPRCGMINPDTLATCAGCGQSLQDAPPPIMARKPQTRLSVLAVVSLVLSLTALVVSFYLFSPFPVDIRRYRFVWLKNAVPGFLVALPAIVCAYVARRRIRCSIGTLWGRPFVFAALVLAYFFPVLTLLLRGCASPAFIVSRRAMWGSCASSLSQIGKACHAYAQDNQGALPDRLSRLYPKYLGPAVFYCPGNWPFDNWGTREERAKNIDNMTSYIYFPNKKLTDLPETILLRDKAENHWYEGINVLRIDGSVHWEGVDWRDEKHSVSSPLGQEAKDFGTIVPNPPFPTPTR